MRESLSKQGHEKLGLAEHAPGVDCRNSSVSGRHTGRRQSNEVDDATGRHSDKRWGADAADVLRILPVNSVAEAATVLGRTMLRTAHGSRRTQYSTLERGRHARRK